MFDKVVAIFVEGATEEEFYKAIINNIHKTNGTKFNCKFEYKNIEGIGNFKKNALRYFKHIKAKYIDKDIYVFLCIDSDVFEYSKKPPIDKNLVKKELLAAGAKQVEYIIAKDSIEEWFLIDFQGVLKYLGLSQNIKVPNQKSGQDKLRKLFSVANKVYVKGKKVEGFIQRLDVNNIFKKNCSSFKSLCRVLNLDCKKLCNKK